MLGQPGAQVVPGLRAELPRLWPGWTVEFLSDRYEEQLARCGGAVRTPAVDLAAGLTTLLARVPEAGYRPDDDGMRRLEAAAAAVRRRLGQSL